MVGERLLSRLGDQEISLRKETSLVFSSLDAIHVVPKLFDRLYDKSEKVRSAADVALINLLKGDSDVAKTISTLLDCMRHGTPENQLESPQNPTDLYEKVEDDTDIPSNPSQLLNMDTKTKQRSLDRVFRLIPKWAECIPSFAWESIIQSVIEKLWSFPQDSIVVKFLSKISSQLSSNCVFVILQVTEKMRSQPKMPDKLESELIAQDLLSSLHHTLYYQSSSPK